VVPYDEIPRRDAGSYRAPVESDPGLDVDALAAGVRERFGIAVERLQFLPVGYSNACYAVECEGRRTHFLKLWPAHAAPPLAQLDAALALQVELADRLERARVVGPIADRAGVRRTEIIGLPAVVFPYVVGTEPAHDDVSVWRWSANVLAELHGLGTFSHLALRRDRFDPSAAPDLRAALGEVDRLVGQADEVRAQLDRLDALHRALRGEPCPTVLCHTDIGGHNLLVGPDGTLTVLDWDWACTSCPEYDLWIAIDTDAAPLVRSYVDGGGTSDLDLARFEYYLLRRAIDDAMARVARLRRTDLTPAERDATVDGIMRWGFARWRRLDHTLDDIAAVLSKS
jgi:hypothetical protein